MISIHVVMICAALTVFFYYLEYICAANGFEWYNAKGSNSKEYKFYAAGQNRALWLARLFLISFIILAIIEQVQFIAVE